MDIVISSGGFSCRIETLGAQLRSFRSPENIEYIWYADKKYWGGSAPVLFPAVGGLRGGRTIIEGKEYRMERHGFARRREFEVFLKSENKAVFVLRSDDATRALYPFDFEFFVGYELDENKLNVSYKTVNKSEKTMPFAVGGHPAFNCPLADGESFEDYRIEFPSPITASSPTVSMETGLIDYAQRVPVLDNESSIPLRHSLFDNDALIFDGLKEKTVSLVGPSHSVKMDFEDFSLLGIWSSLGSAPFVCLEPWIGCATCVDEDDEFVSKRGLVMLGPGMEHEAIFTLTVS